MVIECLEFTEENVCSSWAVDSVFIAVPTFAIVFLLTLIVVNKFFKR
jgi:hypothetical protein